MIRRHQQNIRELKNFNKGRVNDDDVDDDDDNNTGQWPGGASLPLLRYLSSSLSPLPPTPPITPTASLNATQIFLLRPPLQQ